MNGTIVDLDPAATPEELALQIVGLPDGTDMGGDCVGKLGRVLLTGKPEERDPLKYARVFDLAMRDPKATPWMRFAAWAQSVNGRRRAKGADMPAIANELAKLSGEAASQIPNGPHKYLLLGDVAYNLGIVNRGLRRYEDAARAQRVSSAWFGLADNRAKQDVSLFAAQVEEVTSAFVRGDSAHIRVHSTALAALRDYIANTHTYYPAWMQDNACVHIAWALMMGSLFGAIDEKSLMGHQEYFVAGELSRFAAWKTVFETWEAYRRLEFDWVIATNPIDAPSSSLDNSTLTIRILVALAKRMQRDAEGARTILEAVAAHSGPDGGIPIAVANRILATF